MILKINFKVVSPHSKTLVVSRVLLARSPQPGVTKTIVWFARLYRKVVREGFWLWWCRLPSQSPCWRCDRKACPRGKSWSGIVVQGAIRDSVAIGNLQVGLKALGTNPRRSTKTGSGFQNIPLQFGNTYFRPNHWICCDSDGIKVSPTNLLAWNTPCTPIYPYRKIFQHLNPPWIRDKFVGSI